jgi:hypothetical protein
MKITRYIFQNEAEKGVRYIVECETSATTKNEAWEKFRPWAEEHARFSPILVPCDVYLKLTSGGELIRQGDSLD